MSQQVTATTAVTVDRALIPELAGDEVWPVHSVFRQVINLAAPHGLVAVAARDIPMAPRTIVVDVADFGGHRIEPGTCTRVAGGDIRIGGLAVTTVRARHWRPHLPGRPPRRDPRPAIEHALSAHGRRGGMLPSGTAADGGLGRAVQVALADLVQATVIGSTVDIEASCNRLIGLGPGLTPSGDDALVGLFVTGAWLGGRAARPLAVAAHLDYDRTTAVSSNALRAATRGRGSQPLHDLLCAIADGSDSDIERRTTAITAIGHTSGTDTVMGVLAALNLYFDQGEAQ